MAIQLSDHFSYRRLLRFTLPSIGMMIFTSIYGVVDGIFVSNFVGKTPFAAVNLIMPVCMLFGCLGFMVGTGGSALVGKLLGEQKHDEANRVFSMLIYLSAAVGLVVSLIGTAFLRPISVALGAEGEMLKNCIRYGRVLMPASAAFILQSEFQSFLVVAERPRLGLWVTVAAGVTNIVLDALFVGALRWGLEGAAAATVISQVVGAGIPLIWFALAKDSPIRLTGFHFDGKALLQTCFNGSSEMLTNFSLSFVNILYNFQLIRLAGEDGVAAYGVIMYVNFIFIGVYVGYSFGTAPIVSYHFGAQNREELQNILRKSLTLLSIGAAAMTAAAVLLSGPLAAIFTSYDAALYAMTKRGFAIYSLSFLAMWLGIYGSSFFTALNNGLVSAILSVLRTLVFQAAAILILPMLWGLDGVWLAIVAAEALGALATAAFLLKMKKRYGY